jgi:hypothetical protein
MSEGEIVVPLSIFVVKYLKAGKGTEDYVEEMIECALNLLGEDGDFPDHVPSYTLREWRDDSVVLEPMTMGVLFDKTAVRPSRRHELYGMLSLLRETSLKRFVRYLEEDLLERAFNGPAGKG